MPNFDPKAIKAHVFLSVDSNKLCFSPCKDKHAFDISTIFEV